MHLSVLLQEFKLKAYLVLCFISVLIFVFSFSNGPKLCLNIMCFQVLLISKFRITLYYLGSFLYTVIVDLLFVHYLKCIRA